MQAYAGCQHGQIPQGGLRLTWSPLFSLHRGAHQLLHPVITCESEEKDFASWPTYIPNGQNAEVEGQCLDGYEPTDPAQGGPKRICQATGNYRSSVTNPCKRAVPPARQRESQQLGV